MKVCEYSDDQLREIARNHHRLAQWPQTMTEQFVRTQLAAAAAIEELLDRRATDRKFSPLLDMTAHGLAYTYACSVIESSCSGVPEGDSYDLSSEDMENADFNDAVNYLAMRGLLEKHPDNPAWVLLREESEAT